ncbi:MAG TPA: hypothetical protein VHJ82_09925 [Actinomycetota bacterium]|nr:hypothetical protein [Actinomycetota bacterium]
MARRACLAALGVALVLANAFPAPAGPLDGFTSNNVEFVGNIAEFGPSGAVLHGRYFYVTGSRGVVIYDVSNPEDPRQVGIFERAPDDRYVPSDYQPETNGKILVCANCESVDEGDAFQVRDAVFDVRNKRQPRWMAALPHAHHWSCVLDCRWAYGNNGLVVDLRDPANPVPSGSWSEGLETRIPPFYEIFDPFLRSSGTHDVTEVAPGIVLTASVPMYLLDARRDPTHPRVLALSDGSAYSYGYVAWPDFHKGGFPLSNNESGVAHSRCEINNRLEGSTLESAFKTWDGSRWKNDGLVTGIDTYTASNGTYADGDPALSGGLWDPMASAQWGCAPFGFDAHPDFRHTGFVAHAWSGHGTKFLKISRDGHIKQIGFFLGHRTNSLDVDWITNEIVYVTDSHRGIDILRFTGHTP